MLRHEEKRQNQAYASRQKGADLGPRRRDEAFADQPGRNRDDAVERRHDAKHGVKAGIFALGEALRHHPRLKRAKQQRRADAPEQPPGPEHRDAVGDFGEAAGGVEHAKGKAREPSPVPVGQGAHDEGGHGGGEEAAGEEAGHGRLGEVLLVFVERVDVCPLRGRHSTVNPSTVGVEQRHAAYLEPVRRHDQQIDGQENAYELFRAPVAVRDVCRRGFPPQVDVAEMVSVVCPGQSAACRDQEGQCQMVHVHGCGRGSRGLEERRDETGDTDTYSTRSGARAPRLFPSDYELADYELVRVTAKPMGQFAASASKHVTCPCRRKYAFGLVKVSKRSERLMHRSVFPRETVGPICDSAVYKSDSQSRQDLCAPLPQLGHVLDSCHGFTMLRTRFA